MEVARSVILLIMTIWLLLRHVVK